MVASISGASRDVMAIRTERARHRFLLYANIERGRRIINTMFDSLNT